MLSCQASYLTGRANVFYGSKSQRPLTANQSQIETKFSTSKKNVVQDFQTFTKKEQAIREKRILQGQMPNPVSSNEDKAQQMTETLFRNQPGFAIHGRSLQSPSVKVAQKLRSTSQIDYR